MTGFGSWRAPRDAGSPADPKTPNARSGLPTLPPRRTPSHLDLLRDQARDEYASSRGGSVSIIGLFRELMPTRVDAPFYTAIEGRAVICVQLSPAMATTRDDLVPIVEKGANLHVMAWTTGFPLLRTVLMLPPPLNTQCESMLKLTDGSVQEFVADALRTGTVELHVGVSGVDESVALRCRAHDLHQVLGGAVGELCRHDHPTDPARFSEAVDEVERAYPEITSGLSRSTAIVLQPIEHVSGVFRYEKEF